MPSPAETFARRALLIGAISTLAACASTGAKMSTFSQNGLPDAIKVPAGHTVAYEMIGAGELTYACRAKANTSNVYEWAFAGPVATLTARDGAVLGKYYAGPTWESSDGSKVTGTQVAVSPANPGNIPLQLVKANPAMGTGAMQGVSYVQRVATVGGVAPQSTCGADQLNTEQKVKYQADYIFWKAA
jgi:hypothetical protein